MPLNTISAVSQITPVVISTFFKHFRKKLENTGPEKDNDPSKDILFDQAFHIVKKFIDICTLNDIESLQAFTNTHIPSPPWSTVMNVTIPLSSCNKAADLLIEWFGQDKALKEVGGERWWQVRGLDGVEAEWITMRSYLGPTKIRRGEEVESQMHAGLNKLQRVMYYIHGGAFYWGSINTHRYQILRIARKIGGRCFAINYRKAPQYPFPCAVQDVLAGYLYLIRPPPGAKHRAIDPKCIVIAGDSAGGGLTLSLLTLIRDLDLPMPAGATLISPWVDLTHSFPSVMCNTNTDIIPKYGFIHKPSPLWPIPAIVESVVTHVACPSDPTPINQELHRQSAHDLSTTLGEDISQPYIACQPVNGDNDRRSVGTGAGEACVTKLDRPVQVKMENPESEPMELRAQIQLYATNEQLTHPLVSPLLQGSLGNLCPLYILAGDNEVLRDEIVYLAHKASNPQDYPVREQLLRQSQRQQKNVEKFVKPTQIHLQIFDGMPHVMTVYSFYHPVKYAYRAIAAFTIHVIDTPIDVLVKEPFPEAGVTSPAAETDPDSEVEAENTVRVRRASPPPQQAKNAVKEVAKETVNGEERVPRHSTKEDKGTTWKTRSVFAEFPQQTLIGERVDLHGNLRPLEPPDQIPALQIPTDDIGIIKEFPARRYLEGQEKWNRIFHRKAEVIVKRREKQRRKIERLLTRAKERGLLTDEGNPMKEIPSTPGRSEPVSNRRWGSLDLQEERPPPSAIANRRDVPDALILIKRSLLQARPKTAAPGAPGPRKSRALARMLAVIAEEDAEDPIVHSASEKQVRRSWLPIHGLSIWVGILRIFSNEERKKQRKASKRERTDNRRPLG